ncbi:MAG: TlpA family protein disulfide reductase [Tidjanibacter sp.]|nr:TlpA family protein disulfide reductase [Tidjanibacter sp.]
MCTTKPTHTPVKRITTLLALLCATLTLWGQEPARSVGADAASEVVADEYALVGVDDKVPSFEVPMTDGRTISTSDLRGKVVLITLWASWCPSCRKEFSAIAKGALGGLLAEEGFVWLPIAREENLATVKGWLAKKGYDVVSGYDTDRAIYGLFATQEIPRNIVVDADGTITHHESGYSRKGFSQLVAEIEQMLH